MTPNQTQAEAIWVVRRKQIAERFERSSGRDGCGNDAKKAAGIILMTQVCVHESKNQQGRGNRRKNQHGSEANKCWYLLGPVLSTKISTLRGFPHSRDYYCPQFTEEETDTEKLNYLSRITQQEVAELGSEIRP